MYIQHGSRKQYFFTWNKQWKYTYILKISTVKVVNENKNIYKFLCKLKLFKLITVILKLLILHIYFAHLLLEEYIIWHTAKDKQYFINFLMMMMWFGNTSNITTVSLRPQSTFPWKQLKLVLFVLPSIIHKLCFFLLQLLHKIFKPFVCLF